MGLLLHIYPLRWVIGLALLAVYVVSKVRAYWRLRHFKGPFSTGFSDLWHARTIISHRNHLIYKEVLDKYGPIARVGPNDLITSSLDLLCHMSAARSPYSRSLWYNGIARTRPGKDNVFSLIDDNAHTRRRHQMAAGFSGKDNLDLEGTIDTCVTQLVHLIRSKYLSTAHGSKPFDLAQKIQYYALDVISSVSYGEAFGDLAGDGDVNGYIAASESGLQLSAVVIGLGLVRVLHVPWIARILGPKETDRTGFGAVMAQARVLIERRVARGDLDKRSDMLASFSRHGLSADEMVSESSLQLTAGSDTTSTSLRCTMLYLMSHPRVYARLQAEVDAAAAAAAAALGDVASGVVPDRVVRGMPYLQAVIKEGMRVFPPVTDQVPKTVPPGGDTVMIDGKPVFLPGGATVSYGVWALHLSEDIFGPDARLFRPERWLVEQDPARLAVMNRVHDLIFGYGKFQCLGKAIGLMELGKGLFELMRNFDWALAQPENVWKGKNLMGLFVHEDMWVLATDRIRTDSE